MNSTRDVHEQTVAILGDAVAELTRRAVEPTLAPFKDQLSETATRLTAALDAVDAAVYADREQRRKVVELLAVERDDAKEVAVRIVDILAAVRRQGSDLAEARREMAELGAAVVQLTGDANVTGDVELLAGQVAGLRRLVITATVVLVITAAAVAALGVLIVMRT